MKKILLSLLVAAPLGLLAQCTELFISEYLEGSGNNKGIEIYNPTANSVNLTGYVLERYANGSAVVSDQLVLSGTIAPYDVFVIVNGQTTSTPTSPACDTAMQALADQLDGVYPAPTYMNGDDAIGLSHNGTLVDIFGKIGEDPGTAWTDVFPFTDAGGGTWITANHTMIRHSNVKQGVTVSPSAFDSFLEYDTLPSNTWTNLGIHVCDCGTLGIADHSLPTVAIYPNPVQLNQSFTITSPAVISSVEIYGVDGKKIKTITAAVSAKSINISTSDLQKNSYIIKTNTIGRAPASTKITIQ
ncbi:MAG: lamin tail domain-containing protein [Bacteroidia bacterium]